jgi:hypothetical protein
MKRTTIPDDVSEIKQNELFKVKIWKNNGGPFYLTDSTAETKRTRRKIIKTNERFKAREIDIPDAFRDNIQLTDGSIAVKRIEDSIKKAKTTPVYTIESRGGGWYNVIDGQGKIVNDKALKSEDAKQLKEELEK